MPTDPPPARVLILTAAIGAGHDRPAMMLARQIEEERPGTVVEIVDGLAAMGRHAVAIIEDNSRVLFGTPSRHWLFDVQYALFFRFAPLRTLARAVGVLAGGRTLHRLAREHRATVVVSTYPVTTDILGALRRLRRLPAPAIAAITDLAALRFWAAPGIDVHLVTHPESIPEVRSIAGPGPIVPVHGFSPPEFGDPVDVAGARAALGLPASGPIVVVSGGGWAVGDLEGAIAVAREQDAYVVALCGRSDEVRDRVAAAFAADRRVRVEGFTERMCDLLTAADALVHSTAGLTILEARLRGCQPISYGWGVAHIRANNRAFARYGLADVAASRADLSAALARALASPLAPDTSLRAIPSAASVVLAVSDAAASS